MLLEEESSQGNGNRLPRETNSWKVSRCGEVSSWGPLPTMEYVFWRSVIWGNCLHGEPSPRYAPSRIPPLVFSRGDLALCSPGGYYFKMWRNPLSPSGRQSTPVVLEKAIVMEIPRGNDVQNPHNIQIQVTMNSTYLMASISTLATIKAVGFHLSKFCPSTSANMVN